MPTRNEKVAAQMAECREMRNRLARIVDQARALCDEATVAHAKAVAVWPRDHDTHMAVGVAWVEARKAMNLLVEAGRTATRYDRELQARGVDLSLL